MSNGTFAHSTFVYMEEVKIYFTLEYRNPIQVCMLLTNCFVLPASCQLSASKIL